MPDRLESLRKEIHRLDAELVGLIKTRMERVQEIARFKKDNDIPIRDDSRETDVISYVLKQPHEGIDSEKLSMLFQQIMEISRDTQSKVFKSLDQ
ncbi:chorismate mutase [candidate division KSB1 bacterium]|nr:chorismate mutase [candidate division KSB1 bacterium]